MPTSRPVWLFTFLDIYLSTYLSFYVSIYLSVYCLRSYLSTYPPVYLFNCQKYFNTCHIHESTVMIYNDHFTHNQVTFFYFFLLKHQNCWTITIMNWSDQVWTNYQQKIISTYLDFKIVVFFNVNYKSMANRLSTQLDPVYLDQILISLIRKEIAIYRNAAKQITLSADNAEVPVIIR